MTCNQCRAYNERSDAAFCGKCGAKLEPPKYIRRGEWVATASKVVGILVIIYFAYGLLVAPLLSYATLHWLDSGIAGTWSGSLNESILFSAPFNVQLTNATSGFAGKGTGATQLGGTEPVSVGGSQTDGNLSFNILYQDGTKYILKGTIDGGMASGTWTQGWSSGSWTMTRTN